MFLKLLYEKSHVFQTKEKKKKHQVYFHLVSTHTNIFTGKAEYL